MESSHPFIHSHVHPYRVNCLQCHQDVVKFGRQEHLLGVGLVVHLVWGELGLDSIKSRDGQTVFGDLVMESLPSYRKRKERKPVGNTWGGPKASRVIPMKTTSWPFFIRYPPMWRPTRPAPRIATFILTLKNKKKIRRKTKIRFEQQQEISCFQS